MLIFTSSFLLFYHCSHDLASSPAMHTKLTTKDAPLPSSQSLAPLETTSVPPTIITPPEVENSEEACPKISEPSSPASEEDFSSSGEQVFHDDPKTFVPPQFSGNNHYYMVPIPNGVSGAGADGMMPSALPNAPWGGAADTGMLEGMDNCMCTFLSALMFTLCMCSLNMHVQCTCM